MLFLFPYFTPKSLTVVLVGVMVKAIDCEILLSEFERQSRYYVNFWANTHGKGMNPLILPAMG